MMFGLGLDATELAQAGAVGIAVAIVFVGGFVAYRIGMALVDAAKTILTNHLDHLTDEFRGLRTDIVEGLYRVEVGLARMSGQGARPPSLPHRSGPYEHESTPPPPPDSPQTSPTDRPPLTE